MICTFANFDLVFSVIKEFKGSITFRIVKGNGKWQWVRGRAYSLINRGKVEGMVANNIFVR
jgi:hypothetical protein